MTKAQEQLYQSLSHSLAKATNLGSRIFHHNNLEYYYSVYHLYPDPATPFYSQVLDSAHDFGIITTPLLQLYGFITLPNDYRLVLGPTQMESQEKQLLREQLFLLGIDKEHEKEYLRSLNCSPLVSIERMSWLIKFIYLSFQNKELADSDLYVNVRPQNYRSDIQHDQLLQSTDEEKDRTIKEINSFEMEQLFMSYIQNGQPEKLQELFSGSPSIKAGHMSDDTLRQLKDMNICTAAIASRSAIEGGLDYKVAFNLSDIYIQKIELITDAISLKQFVQEIMIDYATLVKKLHYHTNDSTTSNQNFFSACARYVSENIYGVIRVNELAGSLGYTRSYLCNRFKQQTGLTLSQYIQQQKILEASRMLEFTDKSLAEISELFGYSSQSHFQTTFKKLTGMTPLAYRQQKKG